METKLSGRLAIVEQDDWLKPVEGAMTERYAHFCRRLSGIERTAGSLVDYANGYLYFGFQYDPVRRGWWFREWLPGAIDVYLFGDFNGWQRTELPLRRGAGGVWSIFLPDESFAGRLVHGSRVKILVHGRNGWLAVSFRTSRARIFRDNCGRLPNRSTGTATASISLRWAAFISMSAMWA